MKVTQTAVPTDLVTSLVAFRKEVGVLVKSSTNPHFRSNFCPLEVIIPHVDNILSNLGLVYLQSTATDSDGTTYIYGSLFHTSGSTLDLGKYYVGKGQKEVKEKDSEGNSVVRFVFDSQKLGAEVTYARRYAMVTHLGLASEVDKDGEDTKPQSLGNKTSKDLF
jgi:hypothetical protein